MNIHTSRHVITQPLGALRECHRKIEHFLRVLNNVVDGAPVLGLPPPYKSGLENVLDFFSTTAQTHSMDEEDSLYSRLRVDPLGELIVERLEKEHRQAESLYRIIERLGLDWLASGFIGPNQRSEIREATKELVHLSEEHIKIEEQRLFPLASGRLDQETLRQIGNEMTRRRLFIPDSGFRNSLFTE